MTRTWMLLATLAVLPLASCGEAVSPEASREAPEARLYTCSMHPQVLQDRPGTCPICGMDLVPVSAGASADPALVIDPAIVQNMGVRTELVRRQTVFRHVRSIGQVEVGEDQVSVVNLRFGGWAEKVHVDRTGDPVKQGQPLLEIYSPDLVAAQEEYQLAVRSQGVESPLARSARRKLSLWGLRDDDIRTIHVAGVRRTLPIRAPRDGFVLAKNVIEGARIEAGTDIYRIGDLSRIWVTAEVYEFDAPWVEIGQSAQMELTHEQGRVLEGRVSYIYPTLNQMSRTLRVRLEFENPDLRLRPGMFATVYIQYRRVDDVVAVPNEAILDSGKRKLVFVETGAGRFEPREVVIGLTGDRRLTEIRSGLAAGERVVLSGQFLLDSESQLEEAIRKLRAPGAARGDEPRGQVLHECPMHPEIRSLEPGRCSQCGMDLEPREATAAELEALAHAHGDADAHASAAWICPMHPDVRSDAPGRCPTCGMFLEREVGKSAP